MMRTGIRASVAARTTGSSGVWTRPDSSCFHIPARFATRFVEPPENSRGAGRKVTPRSRSLEPRVRGQSVAVAEPRRETFTAVP